MLIALVVCIMRFCNCCLTDVTADLTVCSAGIPGNLSLHLQNELALIQFSPFSFDCTVWWFSESDPTGPEALTSDSAWDGLLMPHWHAVSSSCFSQVHLLAIYWRPQLRYKTQLVSFIPGDPIHRPKDGNRLSGSLKMLLTIWNQSLLCLLLLKDKQEREAVILLIVHCFKFKVEAPGALTQAINSLTHFISL